MPSDYYSILGVSKTATKDEIKKAYHKLAHQYHPHKGGSSANEAKMKEINEAYQVLKDPAKRSQYDQLGSAFQGGGPSGFSGFGNFSDFAQNFNGGNQGGVQFDFDIGDIFGDFFSGGRSRTRTASRAGADIESEINLSFTEAAFGVEKLLRLTKDVVCDKCKGEGAEPGSKVSSCSTCQGTGQVMRNIGFGIGVPSVCGTCNGEGKVPEKKCSKCHGAGVAGSTEEIKVKIPAGVDSGQTVRFTGKGAAAKGGVAGDLFLRIRVAPDVRFERRGYDLVSQKEISITQAALGDKVEIETLDGKVKLKIPEGTQGGKIFQIKGKGVPHLQGRGRGDHLVKIIVKIPDKLSRKQKDLLRELDL